MTQRLPAQDVELVVVVGPSPDIATAAQLLAPHLHEPGATVARIGRLVRALWLAGDPDLERRYYNDVEYHARAFNASYIVAALLLRAAGADLRQ